jgi:DNA repair ATPase RecN
MNLEELKDTLNNIKNAMKELDKAITHHDKEIQKCLINMGKINNILSNPDDITNHLFKYSPERQKKAVIRELSYNYRRHRRNIKENKDKKEKAVKKRDEYKSMIKEINTSSLTECKICYEEKEDIRVLNCGHLLCYECYNKLKERESNNIKCPTCKTIINNLPIRLYY